MLPLELPLEEELLLLQKQLVRCLDIRRRGLLLLLSIGRSLVLVELDSTRLGRTLLFRLLPVATGRTGSNF